MADSVKLEYKGRIAVITIDNDKKLNALNIDGYYQLAAYMNEIAKHEEVFITVLTGKGRYFSAGADVATTGDQPEGDIQRHWIKHFVANNLYVTHAFYTHPKILVTALNGPAIGLSASLIAFSDFIYSTPHAFLLTPFSSIGLVTEGLASRAFVQRLGISKANEALIMSKRITSEELLAVGFVNKIFGECGKGEDEKFRGLVFQEIEERLGGHLIGSSLTKIKALIRKPEREQLDAQGVAEVFGGLERFLEGIPQGEFRKIASGEKRHKL